MKKKIIIAVLLIVVLLLGFLFFKSSSKKDKNEVSYEVVTAEKGDLQLFVEETGQVKSNNEISVCPVDVFAAKAGVIIIPVTRVVQTAVIVLFIIVFLLEIFIFNCIYIDRM